MLRMQGGQVDPTGLIEPLELALVMTMELRAQQSGKRKGGCGDSSDQRATSVRRDNFMSMETPMNVRWHVLCPQRMQLTGQSPPGLDRSAPV